MKINKIKTVYLATMVLFIIGMSVSVTSCRENVDEKHIKTFTGEQVYGQLVKDSVEFSEFLKLIDKAGLKGMLNAYGSYTCLAPTNAAFAAYYKSRGDNFSYKDLTSGEIDTIARTHIIGKEYMVEELSDGIFPTNNMNDRAIKVDFENDLASGGIVVKLNKDAKIIKRNIDVANGVIHKIDKVLTSSTAQLPDFIASDPNLTIFSAALTLTKMRDSLLRIEDKTYVPVEGKDEYDGYVIPAPRKRKFGYTAFVESDELFRSKGINTLEDLIAKAEEWYPAPPQYKTDYTNRNNSLNKFISYHLVEKMIYSQQFFFKSHAAPGAPLYEFTETMYDYRLIKSSNERLTGDALALLNPNTPNEVYVTKSDVTVNGVYHYISDILLYSKGVEDMMSSTRIRFDFSALLPELMNNEMRLSQGAQKNASGDRFNIPHGYFKYMQVSPDTRLIYLAGTPNSNWINFQGDEMMGLGSYDITVRLLPVPPGTYELRFGYSANEWRSVTQLYVDGKPVGIPLDLRIVATDPRIGYKLDSETDDKGVDNDKAMRNRGYMKGPLSYVRYDGNNPVLARNATGALRRIVVTVTFKKYEPHYIRFKSVMDKKTSQCMMDYFEYVPKTVYAPPGGEPESRD